MEKNRKQKLLMIIALVVGIASLSIGFAAFSVSLNISSSASVTPNGDTFSVKFSTNQNSLVTGAVTPSSKTSGVTTSDGVIDNSTNPTIKNLSATFTNPGQYVEYTFYVRNEGEYTAYLNNINFIGKKTCTGNGDATESLVQSACESINISAIIGSTTYTETTPITGHTLAKGAGEQIKIRLEYLANGTSVDGTFSITFPNVALVYSTLDDSTIQPTIPSKAVRVVEGDVNTIGSIVAIDDEQFYIYGHENGNVKLLAMYNLYVGDIVTSVDPITVEHSAISNPTGLQSSSAIGSYFVTGEAIYLPWYGIVEFSNDVKKGTNYSDYSGSIVEDYVNNYRNYLEELGTNIEEARLISKNELEILGCTEIWESTGVCSEAPSWIYSTSYWTGTAYDYESVYGVGRDENLSYGNCFWTRSYSYQYGVRPVIIISESEF